MSEIDSSVYVRSCKWTARYYRAGWNRDWLCQYRLLWRIFPANLLWVLELPPIFLVTPYISSCVCIIFAKPILRIFDVSIKGSTTEQYQTTLSRTPPSLVVSQGIPDMTSKHKSTRNKSMIQNLPSKNPSLPCSLQP